MKYATVVFMLSLFCASVMAKDKVIRLEGIKIKADNEAPQVTYIIPWQSPQGAERLYSPVTGTVIERLKPLDPYGFELEISLHDQWIKSDKRTVDLVGK